MPSKSKVPRPGEHCQGRGSGRRGHDLDKRRRAVPWTHRFAPKSAHISISFEVSRGCASAVTSTSSDWAVLRFLWPKDLGGANAPPCFQGRSVCNSERSAGARGRAREELKTVRPGGRDTRTLLGGWRGKAFWCRGRGAMRFRLRPCAAGAGPGFRQPARRSLDTMAALLNDSS
jgi:hypothetical protein